VRIKLHLAAYLLSNICAKNYQNRFVYVEVIASQSSVVFCDTVYVCMHDWRDIYVRAAAYSLDCHGGAVIYRRLYKTFQFLVELRTESVILMNHEL